MNLYNALLRDICQHPNEHWRKERLADWLSEQGREEESEAWRWVAERKLEPDYNGWYPDTQGNRVYFWMLSCLVPVGVYSLLPQPARSFSWRGTVEENYTQLVAAWIAARQGWKENATT